MREVHGMPNPRANPGRYQAVISMSPPNFGQAAQLRQAEMRTRV
jgi:hypothetical protein